MAAPHDDAATDSQAIITQMRAARDAALAEKQELVERLTRRDVAYEERMTHQSATSAVLKAMSASPGNAQPVFEQIAHRALQVCDSSAVRLVEFDGALAGC